MNKRQKETARKKKESVRKTIKFLRGRHLEDMHKVEDLEKNLKGIGAAYQLSMDLVLSQVCRIFGEVEEDGAFTIAIPVPTMKELMHIKAGKDDENGTYVIKAIPPKKEPEKEEKAE